MSGTVRVRRPEGLGRPSRRDAPEALTEVLHVRVSAADVEALNALAAARRVEVSALVRAAIRVAILFAGEAER